MWDFRRKGWTFRSGGDGPDAPSGSGLFKSTDGGATWTTLDDKTRQGPAAEAVGTRRRHRRAVEAERRLRVHRSRAAAERALSLRRRRQDVAAARPQPEHDLAPVLLRQSHRRSEGREQDLQAGRLAHRQHRRRQELQRHRRRRRTATSTTSGSIRRTPTTSSPATTAASGTRTTAATSWWKADNLPVSQFYHVSVDMDQPVPRLRRPAGQQLVGRRLAVSRAASPTASGRTCTAATASGCSPIRPIPTTSTPSRRAATSGASIARRTRSRDIKPLPELQGRQAPLQLEHADPRQPDAERHALHRLAVPVPLARSRPDVGAHLARSDDERSRRSRSRSSRAASPSTTRRAEMHTTIYAIAESPKNPQRDLGRHRRRQPPGHARRRQDVDERRRQHRRPAEERVGVVASSRATSTPARSTPRSTCTRSAT